MAGCTGGITSGTSPSADTGRGGMSRRMKKIHRRKIILFMRCSCQGTGNPGCGLY